MKYQLRGISGKWNIYDESGIKVGGIRRRAGRKLEYEYGRERRTCELWRTKDEIRLKQAGDIFLTGTFLYPKDQSGKVIQAGIFRPPMPTEMRLAWEGERWSLHQSPSREIEIYRGDCLVGMMSGIVIGRKVLEWSADDDIAPEKRMLCFFLGIYMAEDDTVYAV